MEPLLNNPLWCKQFQQNEQIQIHRWIFESGYYNFDLQHILTLDNGNWTGPRMSCRKHPLRTDRLKATPISFGILCKRRHGFTLSLDMLHDHRCSLISMPDLQPGCEAGYIVVFSRACIRQFCYYSSLAALCVFSNHVFCMLSLLSNRLYRFMFLSQALTKQQEQLLFSRKAWHFKIL